METLWFTHSKEVSDTTISWKDNCVLGFGGDFARVLHATQVTVTGDAYASVLRNSEEAIKEKR
jgi:hypothetical protein